MCRMRNAATARCLCRRIGGFEWWENAVRTLETGSDGIFARSGKGGGKYAAQGVGEADFFGFLQCFLCNMCFDHLICVQVFLRFVQHGLAHHAV